MAKQSCSLAYKISGLPISNAMQAFCVADDGKYVYVAQNHNKYKDVYISRCEINGTTATYKDHMIICDSGHTQILDSYVYGGKTYLWVGLKAYTKTAMRPWATQVGRVEYVAGKKYGNVNSISRITGVTSLRCESAISPDRTVFVLLLESTAKNWCYYVLPLNKINSVFDSNKTMSFDNIKRYKIVYKKDASKGAKIKAALPNSSMQGLTLQNNYNHLYFIGGAIGDKPKINKIKTSNSEVSKTVTLTHNDFNKHTEVENIQLTSDCIYVGVNNKKLSSYENRIYKTNKF